MSLAILIIAAWAGTATAPWIVGAIESAVAVAVMLWVARLLADRNARAVFPPLAGPLLLFALYLVVRSVLSDVEPVARQQALLVFAAILFFFLVINNVNHGAQATLLLWTAVALGTVVAGATCWRALAVMPAAPASEGDAGSWLDNAGQMTGYLQLVFSLAAAHVLFSRRSSVERIVLLLACLVIGEGLVLSFNQSIWPGWLASVFVLGAYLVKRQTEKRRWAILGATLGIMAIAGGLVTLHYLSGERTTELDLQPQRWALWQSAWSIGLHDWKLGSGPGMFPWQFPLYRTLQAAPDVVRNEYLHVFAEHGALGILLLGWAAVSFIRSAINILREREARYSAESGSVPAATRTACSSVGSASGRVGVCAASRSAAWVWGPGAA